MLEVLFQVDLLPAFQSHLKGTAVSDRLGEGGVEAVCTALLKALFLIADAVLGTPQEACHIPWLEETAQGNRSNRLV